MLNGQICEKRMKINYMDRFIERSDFAEKIVRNKQKEKFRFIYE